MSVDHQHVQLQRLDQFLEAVSQHADIVALPQHTRDIPGFHAGWDEKDPS